MKYKHIYFDLDRTLWDYDANAGQAFQIIFEEYRLDQHFPDAVEFFRIFNIYNDVVWEEYRQGSMTKEVLREKRFELTLADRGISDKELAARIGERYMYLTPRQNILAPGTTEVLDHLSKCGCRLYILTNGFSATQYNKMSNSGILHYFDRTFSSEEIGINKPKPEIFHWAVTSVNALKKECLMVGDDLEVDVRGAMNYGIDTAWYNPAGITSELIPTYTIRDLRELIQVL